MTMTATVQSELTNMDIAQLTSSINGKPTTRPRDKASAIKALETAMKDRLGAVGCSELGRILSQPNFLTAHHELGLLCEQEDGDGPGVASGGAGEPEVTVHVGEGAEAVDAPPASPETKRGRGRLPTGHGKRLFPAARLEGNPRRVGSHGHKSLQIIIDHPGISLEDFLVKGGRTVDLRWDIRQVNVRMEG